MIVEMIIIITTMVILTTIIITMIAVLASDGLWDTHTNEEAVALVRGCS